MPQFFYTEISINPLPNLGVITRRSAPKFYEDSIITTSYNKQQMQLNLIQAITAGFQEPYAVSFFFGNAMRFKEKGGDKESKNKGFMGYLLSVGDYHIQNNHLIYDRWYEIEWKIKTDRSISNQTLSISYRIGAKVHDNPNIADTYYLSIKRSRLDVGLLKEYFYHNSGIEYRVDFSTKTNTAIRHYFLIDKKWPVTKDKKAFTLGIGFVSEGAQQYTGELANDKFQRNFQFLIRPNIVF